MRNTSLATKVYRRIRHSIRGTATPPPALGSNLQYSDYADGVAYVLTVVDAYAGFASRDPTLAFYIGLVAAGLYATSNWLKSKGD